MKLQQINKKQLNQLISGTTGKEIELCNGSIPPNHVLNRSLQQAQKAGTEIWSLPYMMLLQDNVVGFCGFKYEPEAGEVEIGYNVAPKQQGRGLAKSAVNQLCDLAFGTGVVENVVALISSINVASLNVVKANNFVFTGIVVDDDNEELEKWVLNKVSYA
ncbi:GNAT family N-acetyltransferase [Vibrio parahaemolyticus]|uniref:GNAT family N-acetyltransferase n=1 Tax=Vibrio parahaemolyticus TaxID=670 RepID=UPI0010EEF08C|nr:GNAT family N-acetyltransferase [Vibrio parahaemolyticus]ELA9326007.1 GNAT family N-acetyltransferase [Vibrio parahaemolyticus]ELB2245006.1 GNAT family N-acetyltransferase [Vibrio parahaemolyticus]MBE4327547.1 GNAT family N-acetyltransferase [Vibrio parahaemolyticus]MDF5473496.1 GNAT family N-acetyltransferase [Vibrio parahaemolyticus]MEA5231050.1 GNAT family N-acetyltransferase [Vibrio parahaemolyticus]